MLQPSQPDQSGLDEMFPKPVEFISHVHLQSLTHLLEVTFILGRPNGSAHIPPSQVVIRAPV